MLDKISGHPQIKILEKLIQNNRMGPVYLFTGPPGVGKKQIALALSQLLICGDGGCGECSSCKKVENITSENLLVVNPDGTQIKVQQVREVLEYLSLQKIGRARVIIINDAHTLNPQAGNALLKTLEDPPSETYFFLITHAEKFILPTIRSRAQIFRFSSLSIEILKKITNAKDWVVSSAQGRIDLIEQMSNPELEELRSHALLILKNINEGEHKEVFTAIKEQLVNKENALFISLCLQQFIRDVFFIKHDLGVLVNPDLKNSLQTLTNWTDEFLHELYKASLTVENLIYQNIDKNLTIENFILQNSTTVQ